MINANELRIGNLVLYKGNIQEISEIHRNRVSFVGHFISVENPKAPIKPKLENNSEIDPIPLTEEILLKCGFIKGEWGYEHEYIELAYGKYLMGYDDDGKLYLSANNAEYGIGNCIEYIHQLQNLYFALTGQELEVKL